MSGRSKVKSGCLTCKKRRVKCDEGRPSCARCLNTGRVCDGYGIWGGGGRAPAPPAKVLVPITKVPRFAVSLTQVLQVGSGKELGAFEYFQQYTTAKMPGVFDSCFWGEQVLQASASEPAVLHAVIALGAAHKDEHQLALREYNTSIFYLQRHFKSKDKDSFPVALTTCMVFICLELLWGNFKTGRMHLQQGLQLLQAKQSRDGLTHTNGPVILRPQLDSVEDHLIEAFTRLNVQSALFGQGSHYLYHIGENCKRGSIYELPSEFNTFGNARQHLDGFINAVYSLSAAACGRTSSQAVFPDHFYARQERLQLALSTWLRVFEASVATMAAKGDRRTQLGLPLLRVYHTMTTIIAATCLRRGDEMVYDSLTTTFERIIEQTHDLWGLASSALEEPILGRLCHGTSKGFTVDMGFIPPLYYTAMKCRVPRLRRMAINFLLAVPHREGVWDGVLVARIARKLIEMEEGQTDCVACDTSLPPSTARLNEVEVVLPDDIAQPAKLVTKQYGGIGGQCRVRITEFKLVTEEPLSDSI